MKRKGRRPRRWLSRSVKGHIGRDRRLEDWEILKAQYSLGVRGLKGGGLNVPIVFPLWWCKNFFQGLGWTEKVVFVWGRKEEKRENGPRGTRSKRKHSANFGSRNLRYELFSCETFIFLTFLPSWVSLMFSFPFLSLRWCGFLFSKVLFENFYYKCNYKVSMSFIW